MALARITSHDACKFVSFSRFFLIMYVPCYSCQTFHDAFFFSVLLWCAMTFQFRATATATHIHELWAPIRSDVVMYYAKIYLFPIAVQPTWVMGFRPYWGSSPYLAKKAYLDEVILIACRMDRLILRWHPGITPRRSRQNFWSMAIFGILDKFLHFICRDSNFVTTQAAGRRLFHWTMPANILVEIIIIYSVHSGTQKPTHTWHI